MSEIKLKDENAMNGLYDEIKNLSHSFKKPHCNGNKFDITPNLLGDWQEDRYE